MTQGLCLIIFVSCVLMPVYCWNEVGIQLCPLLDYAAPCYKVNSAGKGKCRDLTKDGGMEMGGLASSANMYGEKLCFMFYSNTQCSSPDKLKFDDAMAKRCGRDLSTCPTKFAKRIWSIKQC